MPQVHRKPYPKRAAALVVACILFCLAPMAAAAQTVSLPGEKITLELSDEYTVLTTDTLRQEEDLLERLGHSRDSFKRYMEERNMLMVAVTDDNTRQVQVKSYTSDFSEGLGDLSLLDDASLEQAANSLLLEEAGEGLQSWGTVTMGDLTFLKATCKVTGNSADFGYIQYVTVRDGSYYALVYYNFGGDITETQAAEADQIFTSWTLPEKKDGNLLAGGNFILQMVIVGALIAAALVIAILLIVSFFKDAKAKKREEEQTVHIRIKRRKF